MLWISFNKWHDSAGKIFIYKRIYKRGKWTPFVKVSFRYTYEKLYKIIIGQDKKIVSQDEFIKNLIDGQRSLGQASLKVLEKIEKIEHKQTNILDQISDFDSRLKIIEESMNKKKSRIKRTYRKIKKIKE